MRKIAIIPIDKMEILAADTTLNFGTLVYKDDKGKLHPWHIGNKKPWCGVVVGKVLE